MNSDPLSECNFLKGNGMTPAASSKAFRVHTIALFFNAKSFCPTRRYLCGCEGVDEFTLAREMRVVHEVYLHIAWLFRLIKPGFHLYGLF